MADNLLLSILPTFRATFFYVNRLIKVSGIRISFTKDYFASIKSSFFDDEYFLDQSHYTLHFCQSL